MIVFSVTTQMVRSHYFPTLADFSDSTTPTDETVLEMITSESAECIGRLAAAGITATALDASTTPAAYAWCQDTIRLGAAIRAAGGMAGFNKTVGNWQSQRDARYKLLEKLGYLILGDAPAPAQNSNGPQSHIANHSLDTGDDSLISTVIPAFRRDDQL